MSLASRQVVNKLRGTLKVVAVKAPGFGERKTSYLEDIAILTGGQLVKDELGISLEKAGEEVLGVAAKVGGGDAWAEEHCLRQLRQFECFLRYVCC